MNIKRIGKAIMVLLLATPALSSMELMAQNLKMPTLEDLLPGGATYRIAENLPGLQWWGDVCIKPGIDSLFAVNPKNGKETLLTTREKVNKVLNSLITPTETTATPGHKGNKVQHFYNTEFPWPDKPYMLIKLPARYIVYDFEKDEFVKGLPQAGERNGAGTDDFIGTQTGDGNTAGMEETNCDPSLWSCKRSYGCAFPALSGARDLGR